MCITQNWSPGCLDGHTHSPGAQFQASKQLKIKQNVRKIIFYKPCVISNSGNS